MIPKIALVLGTTYTGKTWAAGFLAARIRRPFVIIVHTHPDVSYLHHIRRRGRVRFIGVHTPVPSVSAKLLLQTRKRYRYLYFSLYDLSPAEVRTFLISLIAAVKQVGDLALIIDEAHLFCSRYQVPASVVGFIRGARHFGVDVVLVSHRLQDIDIGIRCVLTHLCLFRVSEGHDLDILRRELGVYDADRLRSLPDRRHVFVNRRTGYISPPSRI